MRKKRKDVCVCRGGGGFCPFCLPLSLLLFPLHSSDVLPSYRLINAFIHEWPILSVLVKYGVMGTTGSMGIIDDFLILKVLSVICFPLSGQELMNDMK